MRMRRDRPDTDDKKGQIGAMIGVPGEVRLFGLFRLRGLLRLWALESVDWPLLVK